MRRLVGVLAAGALLVAGCGAGQSGARLSRAQIRERLRDSPVALQRLHDHAAQLVTSGPTTFHALLRGLRGYPVMVNEGASCCENCRAEAAAFRIASVKFGKRVAFLGVDVADDNTAARRLLQTFLSAYPSYSDPRQAIARSLEAVGYYPQTLFYDVDGQETIDHGGSDPSAAALGHDIERYALR